MKAQLAAYGLRAVRAAERVRWPRFTVRDAVIVVLLAASLVFTANYVNRTQASQRRQGEIVETKLCTTLGRLTRLRPPPGNPVTNPSRAFDQKLHDTLSQLSPDLGCMR